MKFSRAFMYATALVVVAGITSPVQAQLPPDNSGTTRPSAFPQPGVNAGNNGAAFQAPQSYSGQNPIQTNNYGGAIPQPNYANQNTPSSIDPATVRRSQSQMQGDYGTMDRTLGVPLGMTQDAWRNPGRAMAPGQSAPGVVRFQWSENLVMQVRIRDFMTTTIELPQWEHVKSVFIGESVYMQSALPSPNVVMLRTSQSGIDTDVQVFGESGNIYTFYVRSEGFNTKQITDLVVKVEAPAPGSNDGWFHGQEPGFHTGQITGLGGGTPVAMTTPASTYAAPMAPPLPGPLTTGPQGAGGAPMGGNGAAPGDMITPRDKQIFDLRQYAFNPGDRDILPDYAYSDGVWTYFYYGTRARSVGIPTINRVVDGVEMHVNTRTAGRFGEVIIAEARGDFVLRAGSKIGCIKQVKAAVAAR